MRKSLCANDFAIADSIRRSEDYRTTAGQSVVAAGADQVADTARDVDAASMHRDHIAEAGRDRRDVTQVAALNIVVARAQLHAVGVAERRDLPGNVAGLVETEQAERPPAGRG